MSVTPTTVAAENEYRLYGNHLRVAAMLSAVLFCVAMSLLLEYSGGWAIALPFVLAYPYIMIVPRRRESLAWAQALGYVYTLFFLLIALIVAMSAVTARGRVTGLAVCLAVIIAQLYAILSAHRVELSGRALNRITGGMGFSRALAVLYSGFWIFLGVIALPGTIRSREAANEASAVRTVHVMNIALTTYKNEHGALPEHVSLLNGLVDEKIACAEPPCTKAEYRFSYTLRAADAGGPRYTVVAQPIKYGEHGRRSFYTDETGVIRFTIDDRTPTAKDPPLS